MEILAVRRAMQEARRIIAERGGPVMIEALCYRFLHQMGPRPGSEFGYRSREEEQAWLARDPIATCPEKLQRLGVLSAEARAKLDAKVRAVVEKAAAGLDRGAAGQQPARRALGPAARSGHGG